MRWGVIRLVIIGSAFLVGMFVGYPNSSVMAPGTSAADLPSTAGTSLVVTCEAGDPTVEHVMGITGAVEVKCVKSQMHVTRFGTSGPPELQAPARSFPSAPVANIRRNVAPLETPKTSS
jgi:hypothetical protein